MKKLLPLYIAMFLLLPALSFAQFEGEIKINIYSTDDKKQQEVSEMNMYLTADRIFLVGEDKVSLMSGLDASGILIRNDKRDFVFMMGKENALQVTKTEVEGLFDMMGMMNSDSNKNNSAASKTKYTYTERTKKVMGYDTYELVVSDETDQSKYISVWLTPNVDINWGMMGESWRGVPKDFEALNGFSRDTIFKGKNFPLLVESYDNGKVEKVMEVTSMTKSNVAKAMVEVPAGVKTIGIRDFMMKVMMGN